MAVNLTYAVTYNTIKNPRSRITEVNFGDGYRQISIDGINYQEESWQVDFKPITQTQANSLEQILLQSVNGSDNYLYWTGPGESKAKYYTAHNISKIPLASNLWKVTCQLRREFPLV